MAFVLLGSSDGQSLAPPLSERNDSLQPFYYPNLQGMHSGGRASGYKGGPGLLTKNHILAAGLAAAIPKAMAT